MLFDSHTHLDQEEFDSNRADIIAAAQNAGVLEMVAVGTTARSSQKCVRIARQFDGVVAAVGIQPNYIAESTDDDWEKIVQLVDERSRNGSKIVAIGETGLDRHWDYTPFDQQQDYFDRHLRLSQERHLPFIVHMRDCAEDILKMLREARNRGPLHGIMHSFTGDRALAAECLELGLHISFAGMVTFKKSELLRQCAATIPDSRLLLETDSPYLSPEPVRGKRPNHPAHLRHTAQCLAKVRGVTLEMLARQTTENARAIFGHT
jgi:TatD DNase family protein